VCAGTLVHYEQAVRGGAARAGRRTRRKARKEDAASERECGCTGTQRANSQALAGVRVHWYTRSKHSGPADDNDEGEDPVGLVVVRHHGGEQAQQRGDPRPGS
jgi:hypothetical protein